MNYADRVSRSGAAGDRVTVRGGVIGFVENARNRRIVYALAAIVLAAFVFFPRPYVARATLVPQDDLLEYFCSENEKDSEHYR